ncbi:hypothetical protein GCM10010464_48950 [Pseudonocardia yunnanensis]|uniref:Lipocalin-like domain-containing protein n=1 Tax=Pseudonocardia yunnanensis TaxID=58107 RepID=A0ABW4F1R4_9PSEU
MTTAETPAAGELAAELQGRLVGAWTLESWASWKVGSDDITYPLGKDAQGIIMYTPDGYMSAQIMRADRPLLAKADMQGATAAEQSISAEGYLAYTGTYDVTADGSKVNHHVSVSLLPNWVHGVQVRVLKLDGDELVLSPAHPIWINGERQDSRLVWHRARS